MIPAAVVATSVRRTVTLHTVLVLFSQALGAKRVQYPEPIFATYGKSRWSHRIDPTVRP